MANWRRCSFKEHHNPVTLEPLGKECGRDAVELLVWHDGRVSPACKAHGVAALTEDARKLVNHVRRP
jgi:hypothetical protein